MLGFLMSYEIKSSITIESEQEWLTKQTTNYFKALYPTVAFEKEK